MEFSPAFYLLPKFTVGLQLARPSEEETSLAAEYLGVAFSPMSLDERIGELSRELSRQNGVLSEQLKYNSIFQSKEYRASKFVREVVANNREGWRGST